MAGLTLWLLGAGILTAVAAMLLALRRRLFVVTVEGGSMEPSLRDGDRVLARRVSLAGVRPGAVVVVEQPDENLRWTRPPVSRANGTQLMIKRVAAVPGDLPPRHAAPALAHHPASVVPPGHLVAFGDNYRHSFDSKQIGYFPADRLHGVVLRRMRPPWRGKRTGGFRWDPSKK